MAWILLEGLDRSGKSTVAEMYRKQGYEIVHMSAPNKKFSQPGYAGESYLEEIVRMYTAYGGKNVLFDRTLYGEEIWPEVYNRMPLLTTEDFEYLQQLEYHNDAVRYVLYDENVDAHWQRCVDNKEPLNRMEFTMAGRLYDKLAIKYNFEKRQLSDFSSPESVEIPKSDGEGQLAKRANDGSTDSLGSVQQDGAAIYTAVRSSLSLEEKLERANAIRSLLKTSLVKKKGEIFESLEKDINKFLEQELEEIFSEPKKSDFTQEEVQILKLTAQRMKEKLG